MFRQYQDNDKFFKIILSIYLKTFTHLFHSSQNVYIISLPDSLVMVTNERSIAFFQITKQEVELFARITHILSISEIFQILLFYKESLNFNLLFASRFRFWFWVHGKILNDTHLMVIKIYCKRNAKHGVIWRFDKKYCR